MRSLRPDPGPKWIVAVPDQRCATSLTLVLRPHPGTESWRCPKSAEHESYRRHPRGVRALCANFPGEYWRELDRERAYPTEFVARADRGRLSRRADPGGIRRQRPADLGGGRDPGRGPRLRLQRRGLPRADVHHGHDPAARQRRAEAALSARDRHRRTAPAGLRRDRADLRHRYAGAAHHRAARGRRITSSTARRSGPRAPSIPT